MRPSLSLRSPCRRLRLSSGCHRNLIVAVPNQRSIYTILDWYLRIEPELGACLVDHGTTAIRVVDQVVRLGAAAQHDLPAVPTYISGRPDGEVRQLGDGYLGPVNADVVGLPCPAAHQHLEIPCDGVGRVAERALRFAIGEHDDVAPRENVLGEVRDHASVSDLQSWTVVVERPSHAHWNPLLLRVHHAQRLAESFGFVVACPRAGAG